MADEEFLTTAEVCARFRISESTLNRWRKDGDIRAYRLGPRIVRYSAGAIEQYLASTATGRPAS